MLKVIFFDAAGTLIHPRRPVGESYAEIAIRFGNKAGAGEVSSAFRRAFSQARPLAFGPRRGREELRRLEREWWRAVVAETFASLGELNDFEAYFDALFAYFAQPRSWEVSADAPDLLRALRGQGIELGIISNFDYRVVQILEGLGLLEYFDSVTLSAEAGWAKPAPEIFQTALAAHQAAPDQGLHVGDSTHLDIAGAKAVGLEAILVRRHGDAPLARRKGRCPDLEVHSLQAILPYVRERDRSVREFMRRRKDR